VNGGWLVNSAASASPGATRRRAKQPGKLIATG